jgi:hypothetical protein
MNVASTSRRATPALCCNDNGICYGDDRRGSYSLRQIATAAAFLATLEPIKTARVSSYHLKHVAEKWGRENGMEPYVTNGALIVAAAALGFAIEPPRHGGPNVGVGVSQRSLQKTIATMECKVFV